MRIKSSPYELEHMDTVGAPMADAVLDVLLDAPNTPAGHAFRELLKCIVIGDEDVNCLASEFKRRFEGVHENILESIRENADSEIAEWESA